MESRDIAIRRNREELYRSDYQDSKSRDILITGEVMVVGVGESLVTVQFPVYYTERPSFTYGGVLEENQTVTTGVLPTVSGVVVRYELTEIKPFRNFWVGADIAIVTTGVEGQKMIFNYEFIGKAILNPVGQTITTDEII